MALHHVSSITFTEILVTPQYPVNNYEISGTNIVNMLINTNYSLHVTCLS